MLKVTPTQNTNLVLFADLLMQSAVDKLNWRMINQHQALLLSKKRAISKAS